MNADVKRNKKYLLEMKSANPYASVMIYGIAGLVTVATWLLILPLKETRLHYLSSVINDRGLLPYASMYFFYLNILAVIVLRKSPTPSKNIMLIAMLFCAAPLMLGMGGTLFGYHQLANDVWTFLDQALTGCSGPIAWHPVVDNIRVGIRAAWDPAILGGVLSGANYLLLLMQKGMIKSVQQCHCA